MKKVLITGVNGFVGRHLARALKSDFDIYGLDKTISKVSPAVPLDKFVSCDITDPTSIAAALGGLEFSYVIHCAAIAHNDRREFTDEDIIRVNARGTQNLVRYFRDKGLEEFVLFSTVAVYGECGYIGEVAEEYPLRPLTTYARSKVEAEQACFAEPDFPVVVLRFPPIYAHDFLKDLLKRISPVTDILRIEIADGANKYSFCAVQNTCEAVRFVLQHPEEVRRKIFNVTDPCEYSHSVLLQQIEHITGYRPCVRVPKWLVRTVVWLVGLVLPTRRNQFYSIYWKLAEDNVYSSAAIRKLGFQPSVTLFHLTESQEQEN